MCKSEVEFFYNTFNFSIYRSVNKNNLKLYKNRSLSGPVVWGFYEYGHTEHNDIFKRISLKHVWLLCG